MTLSSRYSTFGVDDEREFYRLLYSNIIALYAIDDFVHISSIDVRHNHSAYMTKAAANIPTYARTRFKLAIATTISNPSPLVEVCISTPKSVAKPITLPILSPVKIHGLGPCSQSLRITSSTGEFAAACKIREI